MAKKKAKKAIKKVVKKKSSSKSSKVKALPEFNEKAFKEEHAVDTLLKAEEIKQDSELMKGVNKRLVAKKKALDKLG